MPFCRINNIDTITMWNWRANPTALKMAEDFDIMVYVHTVNELEVAQELIDLGARGGYTDVQTSDMF